MARKPTKDELQERKERNIGYLQDLFPTGTSGEAKIYVHCLRRTISGKKLYRIYAVARRPGKHDPEIINVSGMVSHVTGVRWDQKGDGVWTTEIGELLSSISRIIHPFHNGQSFSVVTL